MANSKSPKPKKGSPSVLIKKRKVLYVVLGCVLAGLLAFMVVNRLTSVEYRVKATDLPISINSQSPARAQIHIKSLHSRQPVLVLSSGKGLHNSFDVTDIRVVPVGWQKYKLTVSTDKNTFTSDALNAPHNTTLQVTIANRLPKGNYEVVLNMNATNKTSLFTVHGVIDKTDTTNKKITKRFVIK